MVKEVVVIVTDDISKDHYNPAGKQIEDVIEHLKTKESIDVVITVNSYIDAYNVFRSNQQVAAVIVDWDLPTPKEPENDAVVQLSRDHYRLLEAIDHTTALYSHYYFSEPSLSMSLLAAPAHGKGTPVPGNHKRRVPDGIKLQAKKLDGVAKLKQEETNGTASTTALTDSGHFRQAPGKTLTKEQLVTLIACDNRILPIFMLTANLNPEVDASIRPFIKEFLWKLEDTPSFIANRIRRVIDDYHEKMLPPFFQGLLNYYDAAKYSWHTPGHMGGVAFLKSPPGSAFFDFLGENTFRTDLSVSVPEMGSLLDHTGPVGQSEALAADTFNADHTYYVTNGTSTGNKIVYDACVSPGDGVWLDRNCHKSIIHATIMRSSNPQYLHPLRNARGTIGPVPLPDFDKVTDNTSLVVLTNSTYDGICYNTSKIVDAVEKKTKHMMFDEAWFPHAHFHTLYKGRYGMSVRKPDRDERPEIPVYSTQSSHKLLSALSQASMVHVCEKNHNFHYFNEAFMMHTSTSPQYSIIASLDVCTAMMAQSGIRMIDDVMLEALTFRKNIYEMNNQVQHVKDPSHKWFFEAWQNPKLFEALEVCRAGDKNCREFALEKLAVPELWELKDSEPWHGFKNVGEGFCMLDPVKVTILTPGVKDISTDKKEENWLEDWGIPAAIVSKFLRTRRIVVEKTDFYSFLIIFSVAITKGKSATFLSALIEFKQKFDKGAKLADVFDDAADKNITLKQYCENIHNFYKTHKILNVLHSIYETIPVKKIQPAVAYSHLVKKTADLVGVDDLVGRVSAVSVAPFPPGIPMLMPGEQFTEGVVEFLKTMQDFDAQFPGFEMELHGVVHDDNGKYQVYCVPEEAAHTNGVRSTRDKK